MHSFLKGSVKLFFKIPTVIRTPGYERQTGANYSLGKGEVGIQFASPY